MLTASAIRARALLQAAALTVAFFFIAGFVESEIIRAISPTELELDWISDVVLSTAFGTAVYLWRHLRATRLELLERERAALVLQTQLDLADALQRRLLPTLPPAPVGFDWAATLQPAGKIGGDFYDWVEAEPGAYLVLIADVSGKGIAAAMALTLIRSTFRQVSRDTCRPAQIAQRMSASFFDEWGGIPYVTGIVVHLSTRDRVLTYTNAGHPPGVLVRTTGERSLDAGGPPLGLLGPVAYEEERIDLADRDVCVLVTDGVTEALLDGPDSAHALIVSKARGARVPAATLAGEIIDRARQGRGPSGLTGWDDDRTVLVIAVPG